MAIYTAYMIKSFHCKQTKAVFNGDRSKRLGPIKRIAERKLQMLDSAATLDFLRSPPANRLETLHGNRKGQHSIRVNDQFRLCFIWKNGHAYQVEIVDYH